MDSNQTAKRTGRRDECWGEATKGAPAFGVRGACSRFLEAGSRGRSRGRCKSAGKPGAVQTLRGTRRHLVRRTSVWSARSLLPLLGGTAVVAGDAKAPTSRTQSKRFAELRGT